MLCAISGEAPQSPVASSKSGNVFEKRLIEAYISEHGKDPVTGEELAAADLIDLKTARVVRPRPPTLTSIPALLATFQNEWDALALEAYTLRQQLAQTRQELSTALYQQDAATRVVARLMRERDEARDALSRVTLGAGGAAAVSNGDRMQVDSEGLPEELGEKVDAIQEKLSKSRRKRPVPKGWATSDVVESFAVKSASDALAPECSSVAVDADKDLALVGGSAGVAAVYSLSEGKTVENLTIGSGAVTGTAWYGSQPVVSTSTGAVKVFDGEKEIMSFTSHAGPANDIVVHPSGDILASVGIDKSFVFYDLVSGKAVSQVYTNSELTTAAFHPDGHLFAAGTADGQIKFYQTKTGAEAATFDLGSYVQSFTFSENGYWFAATGKGSTNVTIFDLRREGAAAQAKVLDTGSPILDISFDYTGQFLATAGPSGVTVQHYAKSSKAWSEPLRSAVPAAAVEWGAEAGSLVAVSPEGSISILGQ